MGSRRRFEVPNHLQGSDRSVHSHPRLQAFERCHNLEGAFQDHQILLALGSSYGFQGWVHPLGTGGLADTPASNLLSWKNEAHLEGSSVQGRHHIEGNRMRAMPEGNLESVVAEGSSRQTGQLGGDLYPTVRHVSKTPTISIQNHSRCTSRADHERCIRSTGRWPLLHSRACPSSRTQTRGRTGTWSQRHTQSLKKEEQDHFD